MLAVAVVLVVLLTYGAGDSDWVRLTTFALLLTGVSANIVVIAANGGRMPVSLDSSYSIPAESEGTHRIADAKTRLAFLGDWIDVRGWLLSPGDVCLYAAIAFLIAARIIELFVGTS